MMLLLFFIYRYGNIVHTNKYNKKLQLPGVLNIKETRGHKQNKNVKKIIVTNR